MRLVGTFMRVYLSSAGLLLGVFGFSFLFIVAASFSMKQVGMSGQELLGLAPGVLWLALLFTVTLCLNQIFAEEREGQVLSGLKVHGFSGTEVVVGKFICVYLFTALATVLSTYEYFFFFQVSEPAIAFQLVLVLLLALVGMVSFGVLLGLATEGLRKSAVLLPVFYIPFCLPVVGVGGALSRSVIRGEDVGFNSPELAILVGFSALGLILMFGLSDRVFQSE